MPDQKPSSTPRRPYLIGYSEYRTNLPRGYDCFLTHRAYIVRADGSGRREVGEELVRRPYTWTQFCGWSPDGRQALIYGAWESPENGAWEEENKTFRMTDGTWLMDIYRLDLASGRLTNLTAPERVSCYNANPFYWPGNPQKMGFGALIDGNSHPFSMDADGRNKQDLNRGPSKFTYGFEASPDGALIAYHKGYQVYIAKADGSNPMHIDAGHPFGFVPQWSPDGQWLLFLSGKQFDCHPHVVRRDGTGLHKLADRQGYRTGVPFLDISYFHNGSSDIPRWSPDGRWVYYNALFGDRLEVMRVSLAGQIERLTHCEANVLNYHPLPSPDGEWLLYGSTRSGQRQLYIARPDGSDAHPITAVGPGWGAMWASWQPVVAEP